MVVPVRTDDSGITQLETKAIRRGIQAAFEIDERIIAPQTLAQFLARDDLPRPLQKNLEHVHGFGLELQFDALLSEFAASRVELEKTEPNDTLPRVVHWQPIFSHGWQPRVLL